MLSWEQMMAGTVSVDISSEIQGIWPVVYRVRITSPEIYIIVEEDCSYWVCLFCPRSQITR